jgi:hypoxanthine phosphoribosyltransferase
VDAGGRVDVLITQEEIRRRVRELAAEISEDYRGRTPLFVGILKGSTLFLADLIRELEIPHEVDFISISSYGNAQTSSGVVRLLKDLECDITGRDVVLVEDIVDTGLTLHYIRQNLETRGPGSLRVVALLDKQERREVTVQVEYVGFVIPDRFVVGYGLDYAELYRGLPHVAVLTPDEERAVLAGEGA